MLMEYHISLLNLLPIQRILYSSFQKFIYHVCVVTRFAQDFWLTRLSYSTSC